ncbi:MAG: DUF6089 family protein [Chitinophagales bacterium]|nr:DUF6089 family protein [Chitinophagales bacterium]
MVPVYRHFYFLILFFLPAFFCGLTAVSAQDTQRDTTFLEGIIASDRTLTAGKVYVVKHNVKIAKDATLTISGNTKLYMKHNTSIVVEGGLKMNGGPGAMIEVTSSNPETPGNGILIRGAQGKDIEIKFTKFSQIKIPLKLDADWFRENILIQNNIFTNIFTGEPTIYIINSSQLASATGGKRATFIFSNNSYVSNWGSIYIENFQSDGMDLQFTDNLLTNNVVYAVKQGDPSNALIYGMFDDLKSKYETKFSGNSIFGNYQINSAVDTIIREVGIGIQGSGESFNIPSNFFRSTDPAYISSTFDHFYQNSNLPLLQVEPVAPSPGESLPPHIWKMRINNKDLSNYSSLPPLANRDLPVEVFFNKPVEAVGDRQLESIVYDTATNQLLINPIEIKEGQWSPDRKLYSFKIDNASFLNSQVGYIIVSNFKDENSQKVPEFTIGQQNAVNSYRRIETGGVASGDMISRPDEFGGLDFDINKGAFLKSKEDVKTLKALTDLGDLSYLGPFETLKKSWEVGFQFGASNYSGTMTDRLTKADEYHLSGGIYGQYNAHKWFSLRAMLWYGQISGNDLTLSSLATRNRSHNFKNYIIEGSLTFHWHLLPYGTNRGERFVPTIFAGLALFSQNPRSRIFLTLDQAGDPVYLRWHDGNIATDWENNTDGYHDGKDIWVPLQAVGTEGQTVEDKNDPEANSGSEDAAFFQNRTAPNKYKKVQLSIPVGFEMSWIIRNSWNIGAILGIRLTTGRYLDDLGGYYFDRMNGHQAIIDANTDPNDPSMSTIKARTRSDKGLLLPNEITYTNDQGTLQTRHTAALLANPTYAFSDQGNYAYSINEPYDNHDARRSASDDSNYDIYFFAGVRVTKILKRDPEKDKKKNEEKRNDAYEKDTDGDGISDSEEKKLGTNIKNADSDGDGLSDKKEQESGTNPTKKDSDNDSVVDGKDKCPTIPGLKTTGGCPQ